MNPGYSEADTYRIFVLPQLKSAGRNGELIKEQLQITAGRIVPEGRSGKRLSAKKPDHNLFYAPNFKILDSQQFMPNKGCRYPFKEFIENKYYRRLALKKNKDPLEQAVKVVLNSIYDKMAHRYAYGQLFNPGIASFITGFTRAQLYRFMVDNKLERDVVAFATDSGAITKEIAGVNSGTLGEIKLDKHAHDVIYLSNGFYRYRGNRNLKRRGVGYDKEKKVEIEHIGTKIGPDGQLYILLETTKTTHIKSGILYNKLKSIGKIEQYEKKVRLNSDRKRNWSGELKSLLETKSYDSSPYNINMIAHIVAKERDETEWEDEREEAYEPESDMYEQLYASKPIFHVIAKQNLLGVS